jgi:hypothetical protein
MMSANAAPAPTGPSLSMLSADATDPAAGFANSDSRFRRACLGESPGFVPAKTVAATVPVPALIGAVETVGMGLAVAEITKETWQSDCQ